MKRVYPNMSNFIKSILDNMPIQVIVTTIFFLALLVTNFNSVTEIEDTYADDVEQQVSTLVEVAILNSNDNVDVPRSDFSRNILYLDEDYFEVYPYLLDKITMLIGMSSVDLKLFKFIENNVNIYDFVSPYISKYYYAFNKSFIHSFVSHGTVEEVANGFESIFPSPFTCNRARAPGRLHCTKHPK
jgi:hypothetical protein